MADKKSEKQEQELVQLLEKLNSNLQKEVSPVRRFIMAVIQGVGTIIGATIVAGIVLGVLSETVDSVDDIPILNKILDSEDLKDIVNKDN